MGQLLKQIFVDLASGKLSQRGALERIEALKLQGSEGIGAALFRPVWRRRERTEAAESEFAERLIIVVDRPADGLRKATGAVVESIRPESEADLAQRYSACARACFERIQAILRSGPSGRTLVQIVVEDGEQSLLAGLAALLKTAALENPQVAGQVILTPVQMTDTELARRLGQELALGTDAMVRYQGGMPEVLRWEEVPDELEEPPSAFQEGGVYLITGGLGALGRLFVREILDRAPGASVVLAGRSPWDAAKRASIEELCSDPGRLRYRQVDLGGLEQVERLIGGVLAEHGRLDGILHTAGMIADNFILRKSAAEFNAVLAPKVAGTFHLDRASRDVPLAFFALFSSFAGAMGNVGQVDYATANAFLAEFAELRNRLVHVGQRHGRTRSINWPLWQAGGMAIDPETLERLRRVTGLKPMRTATGMRAFHRSLALPHSQLLVGEGDLARMRHLFLNGAPAGPDPMERPVEVVGRIDLEALAAGTLGYLCREFSVALNLPAEKIEPEAALEKYGIDSILAMKLTNRLEETFGKLSKTLLFEYQSIEALTRYFVRSHSQRLATLLAPPGDAMGRNPEEARPVPSQPARVERISSRRRARSRDTGSRAAAGESIAIIGLSGRYPESIDLDAYWRNLRAGKDCIVEVPRERWDWHEYFSDDRASGGHHYSKWGGFIAGVDEFDPLFFNISPKEAKLIDPQERLFLQHAWMALEDAGYTRGSMQAPTEESLGGQVGVYAGVMYSEYQLFGAEASARGRRLGIVGSAASIANRVSYALNLHGPSMTLDTMCSSALTAIHLACQDLKQGRTSLALAGGVNVSIHPNKYLVLSSGQFISSDGHCRSFGVGGDGYIPGEGVGVGVLKRLSEAERDGDHIYGVIRGSALNHGGKTNGYTVPNPQAQADAITRALADAQVDARHVSYIEAHGTGTKLGDPIEIAALTSAFGRHSKDTQFCLIGSAKSNIGHCESAAGIAGLTKVLLQMMHQEIVPSLHSAEPNPFIDFPASPFLVNQSLRTWEQPVVDGRKLPRIAGISSFGAGGSNAHLIVEEYQVRDGRPLAPTPVIIPLSARTPEQLQEKARQLLAFIVSRRNGIDLASMAYTLQMGREAMDERVAVVGESVERLADHLRAYVAGEHGIGEIYQGQAKRNREALATFAADVDLKQTVGRWIVEKHLAKLAELWVKGLEVDWNALYDGARPSRMSLPTYPFARERHWIDVASAPPAASRPVGGSVLHPLLHGNTSNLTEQSYRSRFTGKEVFIAGGALFVAAQLEMARAAVRDAVPSSAGEPVELRDVVWGEPIRVTEPTEVVIALSAVGDGEVDFEIYTQRGEEEIVHCQGRAAFSRALAPGKVDLGQRETRGERLVRLPAMDDTGGTEEYVLHPTVVENALRTACGESAPVALSSMRIFSSSPAETIVCVCHQPGSHETADIDLCDVRGVVVAEMRGLSWQRAGAQVTERAGEGPMPPLFRREIGLDGPIAAVLAASAGSKPRGAISLSEPAAGSPAPSSASVGRVRITLPQAGQQGATLALSDVRLWDRGRGIYSIEVASVASPQAIPLLCQALERVQREAELKVLLLSSIDRAFAAGGRQEHNVAAEQRLYQAIASFPYPVVAALSGDVVGAAFTAAALCDLMVCSEDARYGYADACERSDAVRAHVTLLRERFGDARAQDVATAVVSGRELRARGWSCPILPAEEVDSHAEALAAILAEKPKEALRLLKQHLALRLTGLAGAETHLEASALKVAPGPVAVLKYGTGGLEDRTPDGAGAIVLVADGSELPAEAVSTLQRFITESEVPVIGALPGDANGNAWLVSQLCDARVHSLSGLYSTAGAPVGAGTLFIDRLGDDAGREVFLTGESYRGTDLQQRVGSMVAVERGDVVAEATKIAEVWAARAQGGVRGWRRAAATDLSAAWKPAEAAAAAAPLATAVTIPLRSSVVAVTAHSEGIVVVRMEDREARNMFSDALIEGVTEAFGHIEGNPAYKVVILIGYDSYFAAGGTRESLLAIQEGKAKFTDVRIFELPLLCELPVIAAMQGHGLGAGWTMGLFSDLVLMSEESRYVSPYMTYGFTPGAGATWILAQKLGADLARESLFSGRQYTGRELKERGLRVPVLPRAEVYPAALALARRIARGSRTRLLELKHQWTASMRGAVEETYRLELAMHERTFVGRADTRARIRTSLWGEVEPRSSETQALDASAGSPGQVPAIAEGRSTVGDPLADVLGTLRTLLARELQLRESDIDEQMPFVDLGLDSISGVTWIRRINETYRTAIEATKVYNHPSLAELGRHVKEEAEKRGTLPVARAAPAAEAAVSRETATKGETRRLVSRRSCGGAGRLPAGTPTALPSPRVAIVGMAGQFPQARSLGEFWRNLAEGRNCVAEVSHERWNADAYYRAGAPAPGKTNSKWLGALDRYDQFDPLFFNISPTEAEFMDPQQRLFLQASWHAIENAGYDARTLSGSRCGVFVGCATGDYHQLSRRHQLTAQGFTGGATSILAARISYFLNLQGPCVSIDTACSSSLVALAQACDSLVAGGSDMALAGGVYVMSGPDMHIKTAQAGMLSAEGRCFTFDQRADGFVPGEAVGVVVLKRLEDAQRDEDLVLGIIEGWGVNQDGKTNGITAPNPESQTRLMQEVYERHGIDPAEIQLVEAHGTGTKLGDPIEVEGLKAAFGRFTRKRDYCALGSVKSNIGHCLTAAGIAGLIKLLLALKHRQLPPTINCEQLNEHISLKNSPFYVNRQLQEWRPAESGRRQAAISAFGFSGTNAHVVIGEGRRSAEPGSTVTIGPGSTRAIVPLSARTPEQLRQRAEDMLGFVRTEGRGTDLVDLAYTLQVGRAAMDERVSFLVTSLEQLADKLEAYLRGERGIQDVYEGQARRDGEALLAFSMEGEQRPVIDTWVADRDLSKLADLWAKGLELDWEPLWGGTRPRRIDLPVYPFAGERYWIRSEESGTGAAGTAAAVLHPLLHRNTSNLTEHRYTSTFDGDESFLITDDDGVRALPALTCLEMVRAAIDQALPDRPEGSILELLETRWAGPILISGGSELNVALYAQEEGRLDFQVYGREGGEELVHCVGRAVVSPGAAPAKLDLETLAGQTLRLGLTSALDPAGVYVLHPILLERALHAGLASMAGVTGATQSWLPSSLNTLRVVAPLETETVAWVRTASERHRADVPALDIDLAGEGGDVLVQLHGLSVRPMSVRTADAGEIPPSDGRLLATPSWQTRGVEALAGAAAFEREEHRVFLLDRPSGDAALVESLVPGSHCEGGRAQSAENVAARFSRDALAFFEWVQTIVRNRRAGKVLVQLVIADEPESCLNGLSAVLRTATLENPWFTGQLIIVPAGTSPEAIAALLSEERSSVIDPVVRFVQDVRQVLRWQEVEDEHDPPVAFRESGVYLITGGTGGLGLLFAKEVLERTRDARVVLTGRSAPSGETRRRMEILAGYADRADYRQMDPVDLEQAIRVVAGVREECGRLDGILHCAGLMLVEHAIPTKSGAEFMRVLSPKVAGAFNLDEASRGVDLDFFVLFSSVSGVLGNARTVDYAAANAFLDEFAAHRNRLVAANLRCGRTRSINWPLWEAGGMGIDRAWEQALQANTGMRAMRTATGLRAFHRGLDLLTDQMLVVEGDPERIRAYLQKARILDGSSPAAAAHPDRRVEPLLEVRSATEPQGGVEQRQEELKVLLGTVLGINPSKIDHGRAFSEFGLDSLLGASLIAAINQRYGTKVSNARIFDYPNVREFSLFLEQDLRSVPARRVAAAPVVDRPLPPRAPAFSRRRSSRAGRPGGAWRAPLDHRIAVIGMSGRYAGAANLREHWENLAAGRNSVVEVPPSRWDARHQRDPDLSLKDCGVPMWLGALDDIECFDPLFFRISPQEADFIDPHHRLFLQESYRAFEDAGYASATLEKRKCGVYLGIAANEYAQLLAKSGALGEAPVTSNHGAIAAARIAYYLNLKGPAISIDTACSSSLVAVHLACQGLLRGETDMALAGGVALWLSPDSFVSMHHAGMLSPVGQCKAFDETADGIVVGDGVGALVLKRLEDAEADGDFIHGVILGSGINQDGRTNGITAPSVSSQIELEREVYTRHDIDPDSISYVEAHGTGTRLGDPIELEALSTVFQEKTARKGFCAIGSVKSNIGHTTSAAGVAGLQKALLSLKHQTLVPTLHVTKESPHFDFATSPFFVSRETRSWDVAAGHPRRAAVSSFGFSGTNAHLVVEEYPPAAAPERSDPGDGPALVPLSARTEEQLLEKVRELSEFLRGAGESVALADVAYTLQVGREAMEERLAVVVGSVGELAERLTWYVEGKGSLEGACRGRVETGNEAFSSLALDDDMQAAIDRWIERGKLSKLADLWARGLSFDWSKLHGRARPRRVSLPTYPFTKERHWIEPSLADERRFPSAANAKLKSIEDIIEQLDEDLVTTEQGVQALRMLV